MPTTGQQQVIHLPDNPNFNYFLHFKKLIAGLLWVFEKRDGRNRWLVMVQQWLDLEARFPSLLYQKSAFDSDFNNCFQSF